VATALHRDPRWKEFAKRYAFNIPAFMAEVLGAKITWQQEEFATAVSEPGCRVSVSSGHGTGKTFSLGAIALQHLLCYYHSNTVITAPKLDQVRTQVWQEIADQKMRLESGPFGWIAKHIVLMGESVYIKGMKESWWIKAQTAPKGSPENLAGKHRDWLLWLADEASGIPDENFQVINGSLSDARNRLVMTSQPTRPAGYFYNSHHENNKENGGNYTAIVMDSEESPLVSPESVKRWRKEYGGKDSAMYGIKVLGKFPDKNDGMLLAKSEVDRAIGHRAIQKGDEYGRILVADVGEGVYRDESVLGEFHVSGYGEYYDTDARKIDLIDFPIITNARDPVTFAGDIYAKWLTMPDAVVYVDAGGVGAPVAKILENKGVNLVRVKWGAKCFKNKNKEMYSNQRAHCTYSAAEAIKKGRFGLADGPWKTKLTTQASRIPYFFDEKAIVHIEPKDKMKEDGIPSPDLFDVICMAMLEGSHYTPVSAGEGAGGLAKGAMDQAKAEAENAFADVE
jgi:hypothetical protein